MPPSMESSSFFIDGAWKPHLSHMDIVAWDSVILVNKPRFFSSHLALDWKDFSGSPYKITIAKSKLFVYCLCLCLENTEFCLRANILKKKRKNFFFRRTIVSHMFFNRGLYLVIQHKYTKQQADSGSLQGRGGKQKKRILGLLFHLCTLDCVCGGE